MSWTCASQCPACTSFELESRLCFVPFTLQRSSRRRIVDCYNIVFVEMSSRMRRSLGGRAGARRPVVFLSQKSPKRSCASLEVLYSIGGRSELQGRWIISMLRTYERHKAFLGKNEKCVCCDESWQLSRKKKTFTA